MERQPPLTPDAVARLVRARLDGATWPQLAERFARSERQVKLAFLRAQKDSTEALLRPTR